jgi:selenocysteine lyase/cysteine desulfurase
MGERSDFAVVPIAINSMELLQSWGTAAVNERLVHLNRVIWEEATRRGFTGPKEDLRAGHISVVELGDRLRPDLAQRLRDNKAVITVRGTKTRITPHVYNDEGDIRKLFEIVDKLTS